MIFATKMWVVSGPTGCLILEILPFPLGLKDGGIDEFRNKTKICFTSFCDYQLGLNLCHKHTVV